MRKSAGGEGAQEVPNGPAILARIEQVDQVPPGEAVSIGGTIRNLEDLVLDREDVDGSL
jgi:hypothetical protein